MPTRDVDAVMYVKQMPEITLEDGHFHVRYDVGKRARFEFVFSPSTFLQMRKIAARVVDEFHERQSNVVVPQRKGRTRENH